VARVAISSHPQGHRHRHHLRPQPLNNPQKLTPQLLANHSLQTQSRPNYYSPNRWGAIPSYPPLLLVENAPPPPANDGSQRRQFARKPMPFGGVAPVGEMACPGGQKWHISLWDVSMGGICVVVDSPMDEPFGTSFAISVYESFGLGSAFFNAHLRWRTTEANSTYLGLEFEDQDLLQNGCFLIDYVNTDLSNF